MFISFVRYIKNLTDKVFSLSNLLTSAVVYFTWIFQINNKTICEIWMVLLLFQRCDVECAFNNFLRKGGTTGVYTCLSYVMTNPNRESEPPTASRLYRPPTRIIEVKVVVE